MYQAWPWAGTAAACTTTGFVQPTASAQVATTQWPVGYSQYAVSPEMQQQWAAAWASQAQYASYGTNVPVGETQTPAFAGAYPDYQTAPNTASETKKSDDANSSSEKPKNSTDQPKQDESDKIRQLKEQAEKWTSLQSTTTSWSTSASSAVNPTIVTAANNSSLTSTNVTQSTESQGLSKEEEEFERQFKDWEKQFEAWKQQNQNHPDKEAFAQYEKQWQEWRAQLLQRKEQMQKAKAEQSGLAQQSSISGTTAGLVNTTNSTHVTDSVAATSASAMFYQHPQYMYMQQYMYPGATAVAPGPVPQGVVPQGVVPQGAIPQGAIPQGAIPQGVVPPGMMTPTGVPPVSMQPAMPPHPVGYQMPPAAPNSYGNQPHFGMAGPTNENMSFDNQGPQDYENDYNYGHGEEEMGPNFEGYDNSNMPEGDFSRDNWKFGRGRGRGSGRGRSRGRGGRWSDPAEMEGRSGGARPMRKTLLPGGPGTTFAEEDEPPPFEYPTEDCRDQFAKDNPFPDSNEFHDESRPYPPDNNFGPLPYDEQFPTESPFPPDQEFPDRFPPDQRRFGLKRFPPGREGFSRDRFTRDERFPPEQECFPPDHDRFPRKGSRFQNDNRFLPEEERFPAGPDRFPPRHMMDEGGYGEFDQFPQEEEEMFGPPPFRDDFPPFEERGGRGRGRFPGRGRRFRGDFERFGPQYPPRMRNEHFGPPDFTPDDDRFGFPDDGPPRMPPQRVMRPPFEPPPFGPDGMFPDEPGWDGPKRFKSIDYTHRPAAAVMGDDFNPRYDYEAEFQDDVNQYRARPPKRKKRDAQRKSAGEKKKEDKDDKDQDKDSDNANDKVKDN